MRLFKEPLVHFVLLGSLIFALWGLRGKGRAPQDAQPRPDAAPSARTVTVTPADVDAQRAEFRAAWKRDPDAGELGELVQKLVDEEILFREALAQGLDRDDKLVRRRLVEKMTALVRPTAPAREPSRDELERWYRTYSHRFRRPATVTFDVLYFDPRRRADAAGDAARALAAAPAAPGGGDPFILSGATADKTELELAHLLGEGFARAVMDAPAGKWFGPVASTYGSHLVRVTRRTPERLPPFDESEPRVRADWLTVETRGQRAAAEALLPRYDVELPPDLRRQLEGAPALAPYLAKARR
jgi:hypothetical protein